MLVSIDQSAEEDPELIDCTQGSSSPPSSSSPYSISRQNTEHSQGYISILDSAGYKILSADPTEDAPPSPVKIYEPEQFPRPFPLTEEDFRQYDHLSDLWRDLRKGEKSLRKAKRKREEFARRVEKAVEKWEAVGGDSDEGDVFWIGETVKRAMAVKTIAVDVDVVGMEDDDNVELEDDPSNQRRAQSSEPKLVEAASDTTEEGLRGYEIERVPFGGQVSSASDSELENTAHRASTPTGSDATSRSSAHRSDPITTCTSTLQNASRISSEGPAVRTLPSPPATPAASQTHPQTIPGISSQSQMQAELVSRRSMFAHSTEAHRPPIQLPTPSPSPVKNSFPKPFPWREPDPPRQDEAPPVASPGLTLSRSSCLP